MNECTTQRRVKKVTIQCETEETDVESNNDSNSNKDSNNEQEINEDQEMQTQAPINWTRFSSDSENDSEQE